MWVLMAVWPLVPAYVYFSKRQRQLGSGRCRGCLQSRVGARYGLFDVHANNDDDNSESRARTGGGPDGGNNGTGTANQLSRSDTSSFMGGSYDSSYHDDDDIQNGGADDDDLLSGGDGTASGPRGGVSVVWEAAERPMTEKAAAAWLDEQTKDPVGCVLRTRHTRF
jgi:hypothetical protein